MAGVLGPLATQMTTLPIGVPHTGSTAGFAFEMIYAMDNFVPWRESAWAPLSERVGLLAERCAEAVASPAMPERVLHAQARAAALGALFGAEVPTALRSNPN
jgi:hypothetical protein